MQLCLPVFKSELIWHPGGPRRAVALPREMRRKQRGRHSGRTESLAATGQRHRHTNVCSARYRNPTAKAREQLRGGGGAGPAERELQAIGQAQPQSPAPSSSRDAPAQLPGKPGAEGLGAVGKRWPLPPWAPCHPGVARVKVQVPSHCSRPAGRVWRVGDPKI